MNTFMRNAMATTIIICCAVALGGPAAVEAEDASRRTDTMAVARVLEFSVPPALNRPDQQTATVDMVLTEQDTLAIAEGAYVTLVLRDGSVSRFDGPTQVSLASAQGRRRGSLLTRLTSAVLDLFFSKDGGQEEAYLGVRSLAATQTNPLRIPRLLFPPDKCKLIEAPTQFTWQPVEGVLAYTVSLFDSRRLLWQANASSFATELPSADTLIEPGVSYLWIVEAHAGDRSFRSEQATFSILDAESRQKLEGGLSEIDKSVQDPRLAGQLRARLYRGFNLTIEYYREIQAILARYPGDYTAAMMNAGVLEEMGLYEEAARAYRTLLMK